MWTQSIASRIVPKSVSAWAKKHSTLLKGAMYGIGGILDTLTIGFGIYDVIIGTKNLQGSGTITDNLKEQANLVDLSLLGILNIYQDLTGVNTNELMSGNFGNLDLLTGIEIHTW